MSHPVDRVLSRAAFLRMAGLLAAGSVAACSQAASPAPTSVPTTAAKNAAPTVAKPAATAAPATGAKANVTAWVPFGGDTEVALSHLAATFNSQSKNIQLNWQSIQVPGAPVPYTGKLQAAIASGQPPDLVIDFDEAAVQLAGSGVLEPVDALLKQLNINPDTYFVKASIEGETYQGKVWGVPIDWDPDWMLYYNQDLFEKEGIKEPPKTLEELATIAPKFDIVKNGKITRLGYLPWYGWGFYPIAYTYLFGGVGVDTRDGKPNLNSPEVLAGMDYVYQWAKKYPAGELDSFSSGFATLKAGPFPVGQVAMMSVGDWMIPGQEQYAPKMNYAIAPFPVPAAHQNDYHYSSSGWLFLVLKGSKNKNNDTDVIDWFLKDTNLQTLCRSTGWLPAKQSARKGYGKWDPHWAQVIDFADKYSSRFYPEIWPSKDSLAIESAFKSAASLVITLKATPEKAFNDAQKRVLAGL